MAEGRVIRIGEHYSFIEDLSDLQHVYVSRGEIRRAGYDQLLPGEYLSFERHEVSGKFRARALVIGTRGTVRWFNWQKAHGLIDTDRGQLLVFVEEVLQANLRTFGRGMRVHVRPVRHSNQRRKRIARDLRPIDVAPSASP